MPRIIATDLMPEFAGRIVASNRYLLEVKLGSGAYGKVYRALDRAVGNGVPTYRAVKILHRHPKGSDKDRLQQREFSVHRLVSGHRNIVTLHGWFNDTLYVYAVMDLCSGGDLFTAITEKLWYQDQPQRIKVTYLQILDAVKHCHDLKIYHRDIKPENILCSTDGSRVRLADFGLSTSNAFSGEFGCGSSYYMSPECIGNGPHGRDHQYSTLHNDIWALGVILTNMTTGRNPWRYATVNDDCFKAFIRDNNFLKTVLPISAEMNSILKEIFVVDWRIRISIPELRQRIIDLEGIYEAETNIVQPQPRPAVPETFDPLDKHFRWGERVPEFDGRDSLRSSERDAVVSRTQTLHVAEDAEGQGPVVPLQSSDQSLAPPSGSYGSSGSDTRSKGPKTPSSALKAAHPGIEIPSDIPEYRLDNPANVVGQEDGHHTGPAAIEKGKLLKSGQILRSALQRFKGAGAQSN